MKRLLTLLSFLLLCQAQALLAQEISLEKAQVFARQYLQQQLIAMSPDLRLLESSQTAPLARRLPQQGGAPLYYVLSLSPQGGFVVVAGDEQMGPVVGYSAEGVYDPASLPEALTEWLEAQAAQTARVRAGKGVAKLHAPSGLPDSVKPLIKTLWHQREPFNLACPADPSYGETCVTGCVATAMAQVIYHYRYPTQAKGTGYYTVGGANKKTEDLAAYQFNFDDMLLYYASDEKGATDTQRQAVAKLMRACGLAAKMDYGAKGSNAITSCYNLIRNFGYDAACRDVARAQFSDAQWAEMLKTELAGGRPVIYSGRRLTNAAGSSTSGHAFICDGYNADGLYHINWGWGQYNGYFSLDNLNERDPDTYSYEAYNYQQSAIIGIRPSADSQTNPVQNLMTIGFYSYPTSAAQGGTMPLDVTIMTKDRAFNGKVGVGVFGSDEVGTSKPLYSVTEDFSLTSATDPTYYVLRFNLPVNNSDGTFYLRPVYEGDGVADDTPIPLASTSLSYPAYLVMRLSKGVATISRPGMQAGLSVAGYSTVGRAYQGHDYTLSLRIKATNEESFRGQIRLVRNGTPVATTFTSIAASSEKEVCFRVTAPVGGSQDQLAVQCDRGDGQWVHVGSAMSSVYSPGNSTPQLSLSASADKTTYAAGETGRVTATLQNAQGTFEGELLLWAYSDLGYQFLARRVVTLGASESRTFSIPFDVPPYEEGQYYLYMADNNYNVDEYIYFNVGIATDSADLNGDGSVNVGDVTTLVNMILGKTSLVPTADLNADGSVNVGDVTTLVNMILGK